MDKKEIVLIFLICLFVFMPFFLRTGFVGADSYYYVNKVCLDSDYFYEPVFETLFFDLIPCNFLFIKFLMFVSFFASMLVVGYLVQLFFVKKSFFGVLFVYGLSPILFYFVFKFENDVFSLFLLVLSILFYFKSIKNKGYVKFWCYSIVSLVFLYLSAQLSLLNYYFLFIGASNNVLFLIFLIIGIFTTNFQAITALTPSFQVAEMFPLIGLITIFLLLLAWIKPLHKKEMITATLLTALQGKFALFLPFVYLPSLINTIEFLTKKKKINFYHILSIYAIMGLLAFGFLTFTYFPNQETINIVEKSVLLQKDKNIVLYNDWELGHLVINKGYETTYRSSWPNPDYNNLKKPFIALTNQSLGCNMVYKTNQYYVYLCE